MGMRKEESIRLTGYSIMQAWEGGLLQYLMHMNYSLEKARVIAEQMGCLLHTSKVSNLIVATGKILAAKTIIDAEIGVTYHAIGTNNTTPVTGDTTLTTEVARKQITTRTRVVSYSVIICSLTTIQVGRLI
jgi:hypothetical protein